MSDVNYLTPDHDGPPPDCKHGVEAPYMCECCEIERLEKALCREEVEGGEMQALLFEILEKGRTLPGTSEVAIPAILYAELRVWCAQYGHVVPD